MTTITRNNGPIVSGLVFVVGAALGTVMTTTVFFLVGRRNDITVTDGSPWWCVQQRRHAPGSLAHAIETHLRNTQTPAKALGIRVHEFDETQGTYLALEAPLRCNTNVHQTAFAGSLFSIGVLSSFYLARQYMQTQGILPQYRLVARSATIRYRRPVTSQTIIAKSVLPDQDAFTLEAFCEQLERTGKATLNVPGTIILQKDAADGVGVVACEYSVECCAYTPNQKRG